MTKAIAPVLVLSMSLLAHAPVAQAADPRPPFAGVFCGDEADVGRAFIALPSANGILSERALAAFNDAYTAGNAPAAKIKRRLSASTVRGGWCVAEGAVAIDKKAVPLIVSSVGEMTGHGSDRLADCMTHVARPFGNAETATAAKAGTLMKPAAMDDDGPGDPVDALRAAIGDRARMAAFWSVRPDVVLAGSAPGELYVGAKARKTFAAWKLDLAVDGGIRWGYVPSSHTQLAWAVANVRASSGDGAAKTPPVTYRVMFALLADHFEADEDAAPEHDTWHLVLAHFALVE